MDPSTTQILTLLGVLLGGGSAIGVITVALINKFGKGQSDRHTEVALGVSVLEKQIERAQKDKEGWTEIETFLRNLIKTTDKENQELRDLLETAQGRIRALTRERDELLNRQKNLASKFARGEAITLADITGQTDLEQELEDLEDTYISG